MANWDRYSVKGSSGVSAGILTKLMFKSAFLILGKSFFGRKVILKPRTSRGSVQNVYMICVFWNVTDRNCLLEEICIVRVNLRRFLSARASPISSSFSHCFVSFFFFI